MVFWVSGEFGFFWVQCLGVLGFEVIRFFRFGLFGVEGCFGFRVLVFRVVKVCFCC